MKTRNNNLENYLSNFIEKNRLRWTYLRDGASRRKCGCLITFVQTDNLGRKDLFVGWSKVNTRSGDIFSLDVGLAKAIDNAVHCSEFLEIMEDGATRLPKVHQTWRNIRDEHGYITGETEWFDQYEVFASKILRIYPTLNLSSSLSMVSSN